MLPLSKDLKTYIAHSCLGQGMTDEAKITGKRRQGKISWENKGSEGPPHLPGKTGGKACAQNQTHAEERLEITLDLHSGGSVGSRQAGGEG